MSVPMSRLDALKKRLQSAEVVDLCTQLDAEANLSRESSPQPEWLPDPFGPDPFGQDWAWVLPQDEQPTSEVITSPPNQVADSRETVRPVSLALWGGLALAASILLVIGLLIGQRLRDDRKGEVAFAANATAKEDPARGPGTVAGVAVTNQTARKAYLTIVGLSADRRPTVHYREDQQFISVPANGSREVKNFPASFDGCAVVVVLLTATPAGEVVRGLTTDPAPPTGVEGFRDKLIAQLIDSGFTDVGAVIVRVSQ